MTRALVPGDRIGALTVAAQLGAGGHGAVYRAIAADGSEIAVKVANADVVKAPELVVRFEREVQVLAGLAHPNMVRAIGVGRLDDGRPYFAMELLEGEDLGQRLARVGRFTPAEIVAVLGTVCDALAAAHRLGVVHRDIKASNVFVTAAGRVVLLDFGIAKLADEAGPALTASWQILGTPAYRAPEQIGRNADPRSDIYALGALTFEMLTGVPPFSGDSATVMAHLHRHARRPRPSAAGAPPAFDPVVARAMDIDPSRRYERVEELLAAIRAAAVAGAGRSAHGTCPALAAHVSVRARPELPSAVDESLCAEIARVLAAARRWFQDAGFAPVIEGCASVVAVQALTGDPDADDRAREAAREVIADLASATARLRVRADVTVHEAAVELADRIVVGGPLLELGAWPGLAVE